MAATKNVALDLGAQSISMGLFSSEQDKSLILEQFDSRELLADPSADATWLDQSKDAVAELVKSLKAKKQEVQFAVPSQTVFTRFVKLPPLDVEQLEQIVGFEAEQQVPFPLEQAVWDYQTLGDPEDIEVEVVLVAIKANELEAVNHAVRSSGLETKVVDLAPMALYNAFRYNYPDVAEPIVIIDIGARSTNLVYVEGNKLFVRSVLNTGGREITQQIAKEFDISFHEAEQRKLQDGFVALGGGYADHEDPEIAAMSKVIRNGLTRLHAEVIRTNTFYRSNQDGTPPVAAFLSGAGAGLPYLNEFFQEKLKIPVEYFNALRNVKLSKNVDEAVVTSQAHTLGELVGLGLRGVGETPMEISLVPKVIARERLVAKRAPFYWLAGFGLAALLAALGFYYQNATTFADRNSKALGAEVDQLTGFDALIKEQLDRLDLIKKRSDPYSAATRGRIYWITTFLDLSQAFVDDKIWFVEMQPSSNPVPDEPKQRVLLIEEPRGPEIAVASGEGISAAAGPGQYSIDQIRLKGLWRDVGDEDGSKVVYRYFARLQASQNPFFDLVERDEYGQIKLNDAGEATEKFTETEIMQVNQGAAGNRHAWEFNMNLPLPVNRRIPYTK